MRARKQFGSDCWVDVFECACFMGKLHRHFGLLRMERLADGSIVVGPAAMFALEGRRSRRIRRPAGGGVRTQPRGKRPVVIQFGPNRIIPDLAAELRGLALSSAEISIAKAAED